MGVGADGKDTQAGGVTAVRKGMACRSVMIWIVTSRGEGSLRNLYYYCI